MKNNRIQRSQWKFYCNTKPIPCRKHDWEAVHIDYDGEEDKRFFTGESVEDLEEQIEEWEQENL